MPYISNVYARQVLDSRGFPTIQVEVTARKVDFLEVRLFQVVPQQENMKP